MAAHPDLFSDERVLPGYRLDFFELYNWGVFDAKIYRIDCCGESSVLTGANGSGKTTVVDALLTLLVPPRKRFYNQSSGAEQKKDRTEESYVCGAYSSRKDDAYTQAIQETLRKKTAYSVLLGVFKNFGCAQALTLMQFRSFSSDGRLLQHYSVTQKELSLAEVNQIIGGFDAQGKWKKTLSAVCGTVFYGDSFPQYAAAFSRIFGFRSEKALNLLAQTVGVKVLGNLNEFIRTHMLEELPTEDEFQKLHKNYEDLRASHTEIEKTREQIALLKTVLESGTAWKAETAHTAELECLKETVPLFYATHARSLCESERRAVALKINTLSDGRDKEKAHIERLNSELRSLAVAIASNQSALMLKDIEHSLDIAQRERSSRETATASFAAKLRQLALPQETSPPVTQERFEKLNAILVQEGEREKIRKKEAEDAAMDARIGQSAKAGELDAVKAELASLAGRSSNIPLKNIEIRNRVCSVIGCDIADLPFAGELLQVAESEREWEGAIEKLLHGFALCLLVPENIYRQVTKMVQTHNLKGRLVYFKVDSRLLTLDGEQKTGGANRVPSKLHIKRPHPFADWLLEHLQEQFDYLCTDDMNEFTRERCALTSTGLIKNRQRHEKDDRERSDSKTDTPLFARSLRVLGWDNQAKRAELSNRHRILEHEEKQETARRAKAEEISADCERRLRLIADLENITSFSQIDTAEQIRLIDDLLGKKNALLAKSGDLQQLNARKTTAETELTQADQLHQRLISELGGQAQKESQLCAELEKLNADYDGFLAILQQSVSAAKTAQDEADRLLAAFYEKTKIAKRFDSRITLDKAQGKVLAQLDTDLAKTVGLQQKLHAHLIRAMSDFINPRVLTEKYPQWTADTRDLQADGACLEDFAAFYARLDKDDLPRYLAQFRKYLNDRLFEDVIGFSTTLTNAEQDIHTGIRDLNRSLKTIPYTQNPPTHIQLESRQTPDVQIRDFKTLLQNAITDAGSISHGDDAAETNFKRIRALIDKLKENDAYRKKVLDVRNWFLFAAAEYYESDNTQKQYYQDSASLSGGEKAKLAYTILASAIAFQFGIQDEDTRFRSFRFVIIDEAFSKIDPENSRYAMELFRQLQLQLMVVTPMDKINIVEKYVRSVHFTENKGTADSRVHGMHIEKYRELAAQES